MGVPGIFQRIPSASPELEEFGQRPRIGRVSRLKGETDAAMALLLQTLIRHCGTMSASSLKESVLISINPGDCVKVIGALAPWFQEELGIVIAVRPAPTNASDLFVRVRFGLEEDWLKAKSLSVVEPAFQPL